MWLIRDFVGAAWGNRTPDLRTTRREQRVHRVVRRSAPCTSVRRNLCLTGWLGCRSGCRSKASQPRGLVSIDRDEAADGTSPPQCLQLYLVADWGSGRRRLSATYRPIASPWRWPWMVAQRKWNPTQTREIEFSEAACEKLAKWWITGVALSHPATRVVLH